MDLATNLNLVLGAGYHIGSLDRNLLIAIDHNFATRETPDAAYMIYDPSDDAEGFLLVGDDIAQLLDETVTHFELHEDDGEGYNTLAESQARDKAVQGRTIGDIYDAMDTLTRWELQRQQARDKLDGKHGDGMSDAEKQRLAQQIDGLTANIDHLRNMKVTV